MYTSIIRFSLLVILVLNNCICRAQDTTSSKLGPVARGLEKIVQTYRSIYDFRKGEVIASIGAGSGMQEIVYSLMADSLTFYLQDIDLSGLAIQNLESTVQQIYKNAGRTQCNATFLTYRGTGTNTNLPVQAFDKIIVENSLHEFTHPSEMLQSIQANMKPGGILFVRELLAKRAHRKHPVCQKTMFTERSLVTLLHQNGFQLMDKTFISSYDGVVFRFGK